MFDMMKMQFSEKFCLPILVSAGILILGIGISQKPDDAAESRPDQVNTGTAAVRFSDLSHAASDYEEEDLGYELKIVETTTEEEAYFTETLFSAAEKCRAVYIDAEKGNASNIVLEEESVHQMIECIAAEGFPVSCGSDDFNMRNYEPVHEELTKALEGESAETEFLVITPSGRISLYHLWFTDGILTVTHGAAAFDDDAEPVVRYLEKIQVYDWEYTDKGWLIWEKALSQNQEMDMHVFHRILPLEGRCRELGSKYITSIGYFCNNLFLTDWDAETVEEVEFNDVYDFLYTIETGERIDDGQYPEGIPADEFENVILKYFDISREELKSCAGYDEETEVYPWTPIGYWNRIQQFLPFPEVVNYEEKEDGTTVIYVDAVFPEWGTDCSFSHEVILRENTDGTWVYLGNKIDRENAFLVPEFRSRRSYTADEP